MNLDLMEIIENFLINSKNSETIRNISLDRIENKPTITLIKLSKCYSRY